MKVSWASRAGDGKWVAVTNANYGGKGNHVLVSTDLRDVEAGRRVPESPERDRVRQRPLDRDGVARYAPALGPTEEVSYRARHLLEHRRRPLDAGRRPGERHSPDRSGQPGRLRSGCLRQRRVAHRCRPRSMPPPAARSRRCRCSRARTEQHWTANGSQFNGSIGTSLAFGDGKWTLASCPGHGAADVNTSANGMAWTASSNDLCSGAHPGDRGRNRRMDRDRRHRRCVRPDSTFLTSTDAKTWKPIGSVPTFVWALAYGGPEATAPVGSGQASLRRRRRCRSRRSRSTTTGSPSTTNR